MRKETKKYFFSVEGETEKRYFDWLQNNINRTSTALYTVKFDCHIQKDPLKRAKGLIILEKTRVTHIVDKESEDETHFLEFKTALDRMKKSERLGKKIKYHLGYSNFAFELWIVLHKYECYNTLTYRHQYLPLINKAFNEEFENLDKFKHEANFKRVLNRFTLDDVRNAIIRSKHIALINQERGYKLQQYKGYNFYSENPSLSIWEVIEEILKDCRLS